MFDYESMTKKELLGHVVAYAEALHELSSRCMAAEGRLQMIERHRRVFDDFKMVP